MRRLAPGALMLAALAALCALALPRGLADLRAFEARVALNAWETKRIQPPLEEWRFAQDRLREARELDSGQPDFLEDLARLYTLRALAPKAGDANAQGDLRQALAFQREALRRRPGSAYTWANIVLLKAHLSETDREFEAALRNAALLGPWEPQVQLAIADAGFRQWPSLAADTRAVLRANAARALRRQDAKLFNLARRAGRLDVLCSVPGVARSPLARACI